MRTKIYQEIGKEDLNHPIAIIGLPGIARVGKLAVVRMIVELNAKRIMDIFPYDFPAWIIVGKDGVARPLKSSIFFYRGYNRDFFFLTGDAQPLSPVGLHKFSKFIVQKFHELGCELIIALAAFSTGKVPEQPKIHVAATNENLLNQFLEYENTVLFNGGTITGANGLIPAYGKLYYDIDGVVLLAETYENLKMDPKASEVLVNMLNTKLKLNIDTSKINLNDRRLREFFERIDIEEEEKIQEPGKDRTYIT